MRQQADWHPGEFRARGKHVESRPDVRDALLEVLDAFAGGLANPGIVDAQAGNSLGREAFRKKFEHWRA